MGNYSNTSLVSYLKSKGSIQSKKVEKAFLCVDRKDFVLGKFKHYAYHDMALPLIEGSTISQPSVIAEML